MMTTSSYLHSIFVLLAAMALVSILETALPFFRTADTRFRHLGPNLKLTAMTLGMNLMFNASVVLFTAWIRPRGLFGAALLSPGLWMLVAIVVLDGSAYLCHRLMHVLPLLWKAHSVHHSDALVDVTTSFRFHPIETTWRFLFTVVPALVFGIPAHAVAAYRVASAIMALFEHMNVRLWQPLDTALSFVVGTPNMHKVHHSRREAQTNSNYGNIFSLFDRLFGTFTPTVQASEVRYGLDGLSGDDVPELLLRPFAVLRPSTPRPLDPRAPS